MCLVFDSSPPTDTTDSLRELDSLEATIRNLSSEVEATSKKIQRTTDSSGIGLVFAGIFLVLTSALLIGLALITVFR